MDGIIDMHASSLGAFHASPATNADAGAKVQQAISHLREERKRRQRYVVDVKTGDQIDVITDGCLAHQAQI